MKQKIIAPLIIFISSLSFFTNVVHADTNTMQVDPCTNLEGGKWVGKFNGDEITAAFSKIDDYMMLIQYKKGQSLVWELNCKRKTDILGEITVKSPFLTGGIKNNTIMLADSTGNFITLKKL